MLRNLSVITFCVSCYHLYISFEINDIVSMVEIFLCGLWTMYRTNNTLKIITHVLGAGQIWFMQYGLFPMGTFYFCLIFFSDLLMS